MLGDQVADEPITTDVVEDTTGVDSAVVSSETTAEVTEPEVQPEVAEVTDTETQIDPEDEDIAYLRQKGVDPSDPEALKKAAQMYRGAEKKMHETTAASGLANTLASFNQPIVQQPQPAYPQQQADPNYNPYEQPDPVYAQTQQQLASLQQTQVQLQSQMAYSALVAAHPEVVSDPKLNEEMSKLVDPNQGGDPILARNLENVFRLAKANMSEDLIAQAEERGRKEATAALARKQRASSASSNAAAAAPSDNKIKASWVASLSTEDYFKNQAMIQAAINSGNFVQD